MPRPTDLMLAELMAARLCHDLVGSVGAVANGVELLGDSRSRPEVGIVEFEHTAFNQNDAIVAICKRHAMMKRQPQA